MKKHLGEVIMQYSVLMSVYAKEKAEYLRSAMNSMWEQTLPTNDFVLVCDGPLNDELDKVIDEMRQEHYATLNVVNLEKNSGLGNALNIGIKYCKNELIARMDSDDISRLDRCERQIQVFRDCSEIGICSGVVEEFMGSIDQIKAKRILPETHDKIQIFAKKRNPFNHPCVMYKKDAVEKAGGYKEFYLLEDYYLWIRMLQNGVIGYNIQQPLLWMRAGSDLYKRRSGWKYMRSQKALFKYMLDSEFISKSQYKRSILLRSLSSLSPNWLREAMFKTVMRKK